MREAMHNLAFACFSDRRLPWAAAGVAALVATWLVLANGGTINRDGILYLSVASHFLAGNWALGFTEYPWPFYPALLAGGRWLTGFPLQQVGHLLSVIFFSASTAAFVMVLREAGGRRETQVAGMLLFLASPYLVGDIVPMVVREHGFWAFLLWALWALLRFCNRRRFVYAVYWGVFASIAVLFRIEGLSFLLMLPFALLLQSHRTVRERMVMLVQSHTVLLVSVTVLLLALLLVPSLSIQKMGRLHEPMAIAANVVDQLTHGLQHKAAIYGRTVLAPWLEKFAMPGLLLTLAWVLVVKILGTAGMLQSALFAMTLGQGERRKSVVGLPVLLGFLVIGLINSVFILLNSFLLSGRMTSPVAFAIALLGAFALADLYQQRRRSRFLVGLASILLLMQLLATLWPSGRDSAYEVEAVRWVESARLPGQQVFYDDNRLRYYAGHPHALASQNSGWKGLRKLIESGEIGQYQMLVVHVRDLGPDQIQFLESRLGKPTKVFYGPRNKKLFVYQPLAMQDRK